MRELSAMSNKPTILFVDDEERILRTLEMSFRHIFNVITTTDGYEALKLLKKQEVDVIISDQRMPLISGACCTRNKPFHNENSIDGIF